MDNPPPVLIRNKLALGIPTAEDAGVWKHSSGALAIGAYTPATPSSSDLITALGYTPADESEVILQAEKNAANGVAGLDASGNIVGYVETYSDTEANLKTQVIPDGVLVYATDTKSYFKGDGTTLGGVFQFAVPFFYGNGDGVTSGSVATELTSTSSVTLQSINIPANASYRLTGLINFGTDNDSVSNFRVTFNKFATGRLPWVNPSASIAGYTHTLIGRADWSYPTAGTTEIATATGQVIKSTHPTTNVTCTPTDLTKTYANFHFDVVTGSNVAGALNIQVSLRQAKSLASTIVANYSMMAVRIK